MVIDKSDFRSYVEHKRNIEKQIQQVNEVTLTWTEIKL